MGKLIKLILIILLFIKIAHAQLLEIPDCNSDEYYELERGGTLVLNCRLVYVYTELAHKKLLANQVKADSLEKLKSQFIAVKDSMHAIKNKIMTHQQKIIKIQNTAYDSLYKRFNDADALVIRATDNTDKALGLITQMKITSAVSGGVMGAVAGGVVGGRIESSEGFRFNIWGAGIGALTGAIVNLWLLNIL